MSNRFEERLSECLEALASGERTLAECLSLYPEDAERLEPLLRTAVFVGETLNVPPRPAFAAEARERFLAMTEPVLREQLAAEPRLSFVMAARRRFLTAAQEILAPRRPSRWQPVFRLAASVAAILVLGFLSVGGFAVTTSANTLPGDWRYPVKRTMEDIRYTLTFDQGGRRQLDIEYTQKRLDEVQKLAERGDKIGEGPLNDLAAQTNSLVTANLDLKDAEKVSELAQQQQVVLQNVAPQVDPNATDELQEAQVMSAKAYLMAATTVVEATEGQAASPTAEPTLTTTAEAPAAAPTETMETAEPTQPAAPTATPQPKAPEITPIPGQLVEAPIQNEQDAGVSWSLVVVGRLSVDVPSSDGWSLLGLDVGSDGVATAPFLLRVANADLSTIISINTENGDAYWDQNINDKYQELVIRQANGPVVWQATQDQLTAFSAANVDIILHFLDSIKMAPRPTATPKPTRTSTPAPTMSASDATTTPAADSGN